MPHKNRDAVSAAAPKRSRKKPSAPAPSPAVVNEPQADWKPLLIAPLYYSSSGYIRTPEAWQQHLRTLVGHSSSAAEWSLEVVGLEQELWWVSIMAMGMTTNIHSEGTVVVRTDDGSSAVHGRASAILDKDWSSFPSELQKNTDWHKSALGQFLYMSQVDFVEALIAGAARIMARKNTVFAPFEHVTWDQWQYFELDEEGTRASRCDDAWHDPRPGVLSSSSDELSSATGPTGEKLFAIHIAPGVAGPAAESDDVDAEGKCQQWLINLMQRFPDRQPEPLATLCRKALDQFPGLSKRGFYRSLLLARSFTSNETWSDAGRLPKSPQKSPH